MSPTAAIGTLFSGIDFQSAQGYRVAKIALDQQRAEGQAVEKLLESARAAAPASDPTGPSGRLVDTYA